VVEVRLLQQRAYDRRLEVFGKDSRRKLRIDDVCNGWEKFVNAIREKDTGQRVEVAGLDGHLLDQVLDVVSSDRLEAGKW
jgi:hypothetical protein